MVTGASQVSGSSSNHLYEVSEGSYSGIGLLAGVGTDMPFVIIDTMSGEGAVGALVKLSADVGLHESQGCTSAGPRTTVAQHHL